MSTERDELAEVIRGIDGPATLGGQEVADAILSAGYRKIFDGDCGLSSVKDPTEREAAEAWMRWANLAMNDEIGAIGAMKQMLTEFGYRKPRTITTAEELDALPENTVIRDSEPATMQLMDGKWWSVGSSLPWDADTIDLPATVLYDPGAAK